MNRILRGALLASMIAAIGLVGCSSRTKIDTTVTETTTDERGNPVTTVTETNTIKAENVSVIEGLAPIMEQCVGDIEKEDAANRKKELLDMLPEPADCSKAGFSTSQTMCYDKNSQITTTMILGIALHNATAKDKQLESPQAFCARQVAAIAQGYHDKESAQAHAWQVVGLTTAIAVPGAYVFSRGFDMMGNMAAGQGDEITTGNISMTKSDDPIGGGEGGGAATVNGSQVLNLGSGNTATDQGMTAENVDKAMATSFKDADSNLDGTATESSGVQLNDANDGSNNSGRLF